MDALHCHARRFASSSPFGIPDLLAQGEAFALPEHVRLRPYRSRRHRLDPSRDVCHFYLDDYRFEPAWTRPGPATAHVRGYLAVCTPDFSLFPEWPIAAQIWNTYRSRWLGRLWQDAEIPLIPTVNWSDARSFDFCFDGIPRDQVVTIAVADLRKPAVERLFRAGFEAMLERLNPRLVLIYGRLRADPGCPVLEFPPEWERLRSL